MVALTCLAAALIMVAAVALGRWIARIRDGKWASIDSAPKDGTEVLGWRKDCGVLVICWTSPSAIMSDAEQEEGGLDELTLYADDWFWVGAWQRLEGSETPTHWMPMPPDPAIARPKLSEPGLSKKRAAEANWWPRLEASKNEPAFIGEKCGGFC